MEDITKTGPVGLEGMNGLNQSPSTYSQYFENLGRMSTSQLSRAYMSPASEDVGVQLAEAGYGSSSYDDAVTSMTQLEDLNELRAQEQPWYAQVASGLAKGAILAGTTFLDGTIGLLMGTGQGIANLADDDPNTGFLSGLWDNDFSKAMQKINEDSEKWMPNYYTQEEQNSPWYENIFTSNFIGDKFIKNLGFSVGAIYSGAVASKILKVTKLPQILGAITESTEMPAMITSTVGATISAVNEGRVEALNNSKDWFEYQKAQLDDEYKQRTDAALEEYEATKGSMVGSMETGFYDPAYIKYQEALSKEEEAYNKALGKLSEDRVKMGNADLLMNIPILATSNYLQFAKFYANGFKTARRTANIVGRAGEYAAGTTKAGAVWAATKGALSEGVGEISQKAVSEVSGDYYATDVNNFYKSKTDREAEIEALDWAKSFSKGINKTVNDGSSWEEFFIGSLTGLLGIPSFRSVKSADGTFQSPVILEGGAYNHWREYQENRTKEQQIVDYMNSRVQSPEFLNYYQGLIRHNKYQRDMNQAVEDNDEFNFKNAEHAQLVSDIIMFDNAGKLEDLITLINAAYDTSDENLQSIIENTTSITEDGKKVGPFIDSNGNPLYATPEGKEEMIEKLTQNKGSISKTIDTYIKAKNSIDSKTGQQFSDSQLEELAWMKVQLSNWADRATEMSEEVNQTIGKVIGNLNSFIGFQDAIRTEEGMRHANLTDRYNIADRNVREAEKAVATLNAVRSLDNVSLAATLAKNPDFVNGLIQEISMLDDTVIATDEREDVINKLKDIVKLGNASAIYNNKFNEYLANPGKQIADHNRADQEAAQAAQEEVTTSLRERLNQATSVGQFRQILNDEEDSAARDTVLQAMESEGNQLAKNYKETLQYNSELGKALNELGETDQVTQDAMTLWKEQFDAAENLEQLSNLNSVYINNENAFLEDSEGDTDPAGSRFQNARYALQKAMSKVNNSLRFRDRFSPEYPQPTSTSEVSRSVDRDTTGDSGTATVPPVNPNATPVETPSIPVGNVTAEEVAADNRDTNRRVETQKDLDQSQQGQRKYYRPAIPELHIEASKEGDFRPFDVVAPEREQGVDFSGIYSYLRDNGAFSYINAAKLKVGDTLGFMIDPDFNDHTIFLVDTRNNQIVGSIDELDSSVAKYEGLAEIIKKVRDEYQASRQGKPTYDTSTGLLSEEYVNSIVRNSPEIPYDTLTWSEEQNKAIASSGKSRVVDMAGRKVVVIDINGFHMPFYLSTGHGGKVDVTSGKWYPIFGIGQDGWLNKLSGTEINDYYGSPVLKQISEALDNIYGDIRQDESVPKVEATGSHTDFINQDLNPTENDQRNTRELVEKNIAKAKSKLTEAASKLTTTTPATGKFFATPQTRVSKMMVGRIPYSTEERSLADIPGVLDGDSRPMFGIIKNGTLSTNEKIDDRLIIKPIDMAQKEGRLYLLIPNAAGTYSPAAVRVKHFNNQEFNLNDATVASTPIGRSINEALDKLASASSQDDVSIAMKGLAQNIYMEDVMVTWFNAKAGSGVVISKKIRKPDGTYETVTINGQEQDKENKYTIYYQNSKKVAEINGLEYDYEAAKEAGVDLSIFGQTKDVAEIKRDILNTILGFNLPIQVSASKINDSGYNNRIIKSNILTSNLREARVIGNWFTTDYFDKQGNLQQAISPASVKPGPGRRTTTPVGGTEGVIQGTSVTIGGSSYTVDLKSSIYTDSSGRKHSATTGNRNIFEMAWAQEAFGDNTESSVMTENKVITPSNQVLDRNTGQYIGGNEALKILDKISGKNQGSGEKVAQAKRVVADIYENQKKVDKTRTDGEFYYVLEDDGQYHEYSRVHTRLGSNWIQSDKQANALNTIREDLTKLIDRPQLFNEYLDELASKYSQYALDFSSFKGKTDAKSRETIVNIIRDKVSGTNSQRALDVGSAVDSVIRDFFTSNTIPARPSNLSELAFSDLISSLTEIKTRMASMGETFLTDNIVLFQKYPDGTRVAGEVDILSIDKDGNFKIYDVKTSRYSFYDFTDRYGHTVNYFKNKSNTQRMSTEDYYTLQLSAYKNLFESQYGVPVTKLRVLPFVLSYSKDEVSGIKMEKGIPITYNSAVNVPIVTASQPSTQDNTLPIFDAGLETIQPQNEVIPENAFEDGKGQIGYYEKDGTLYTGTIKKIGDVEVTYMSGQKATIPIHVTKIRDKGFGRGEFGNTSEYIVVFPNGYALTVVGRGENDKQAFDLIMQALSAKPDNVRDLAAKKTQIHNPRELEESEIEFRSNQSSPQTPQGGAASTVQKENAVNKKSAKRTRHKLRAVDGQRPVWNQEKELAWLKKVLPQLSEQDRVKVVKGLIQVAENGPVAWGRFSDGVITLSDIAAEGTAYHEAFHAVFDLMMTSKERGDILIEARKKWGRKSYSELMELLAEDFREYVTAQEDKGWGAKILNFFKNLFIKVQNWNRVRPSLTAFYRAINKGEYSNRELTNPINRNGQTVLNLESALNNNPFAADFIRKVSKLGYILSGSASYSLQGTVYRKVQDNLHDIDLIADIKHTTNPSIILNKLGYNSTMVNEFRNIRTYVVSKYPMHSTNGELTIVTPDGEFTSQQVLDREVPDTMMVDFIMEPAGGVETHKLTIGGIDLTIQDAKQIEDAKLSMSRDKDISDLANYEFGDRRTPITSWRSLNSETRQALEAKGWTQKKFDSISQAERDNAVECVVL